MLSSAQEYAVKKLMYDVERCLFRGLTAQQIEAVVEHVVRQKAPSVDGKVVTSTLARRH